MKPFVFPFAFASSGITISISITGPLLVNSLNETTYLISGTTSGVSDGTNVAISVTGGGVVNGNATVTSNTWSTTLNLSTLNEGAISASATVLSVNDVLAGTKDTLATIAISSPMADITTLNGASYSVAGTTNFVNDGASVTITASGINRDTNLADSVIDNAIVSSGTWTVNMDLGILKTGTINFSADVTDSSGNTANDTDSANKIQYSESDFFLFGGLDAGVDSSVTEMYKYTTDSWDNSTVNLTYSTRYNQSSTGFYTASDTIEGAYSYGGGNTVGSQANHAKYNKAGNSWTAKTVIPQAIQYGASATWTFLGQKINLLSGGNTSNVSANRVGTIRNFFTDSETWSVGSQTGVVRAGHFASPDYTNETYVYAFGGINSAGTTQNVVEQIDLGGGTITSNSLWNLTTPVHSIMKSGFTLGPNIHIIGGNSGIQTHVSFNVSSLTYSSKANYPVNTSFGMGGTLVYNSIGIIKGSQTGVFKYDTGLNSFSATTTPNDLNIGGGTSGL